MNVIRTGILSCVAALIVSAAACADEHAPTGMVLLTVGGNVDTPTHGPATAEDVSMLAVLDVALEAAMEFDAAALPALEQGSYRKNLHEGRAAGTFSGPSLAALLGAVGRPYGNAEPVAHDGYRPFIPAEQIADHDPILATLLDGRPLGLGWLGPAMVVFTDVDDPDLQESLAALEVWATIYIEVE